MNIKFGNMKQIIVSLILVGIVAAATVSSHVANIHLVVTIFLGGCNMYLLYQITNKKVKLKHGMPASYAYLTAFAVNSILSFAFSWWFSGIVWAYILCVYIHSHQSNEKEQEEGPVEKINVRRKQHEKP